MYVTLKVEFDLIVFHIIIIDYSIVIEIKDSKSNTKENWWTFLNSKI